MGNRKPAGSQCFLQSQELRLAYLFLASCLISLKIFVAFVETSFSSVTFKFEKPPVVSGSH